MREFFITHRDKLFWYLIFIGICNVVQVMMFYQFTLRCTACFLWRTRRISRKMTRKMREMTPDNPVSNFQFDATERFNRWFRRSYRKPWMRALWILQGVAFIAMGVAGLTLL